MNAKNFSSKLIRVRCPSGTGGFSFANAPTKNGSFGFGVWKQSVVLLIVKCERKVLRIRRTILHGIICAKRRHTRYTCI